MIFHKKIRPGLRLYRMDYHLSGKTYIITEYNRKTGFGEMEDEKTKEVYIFNKWTIIKGALNQSPQESIAYYYRALKLGDNASVYFT